jgi:tetratricopeptide (TPR) repeat protein
MGVRAVKIVSVIILTLITAWAIASVHPAYAQSPSPAEFMESANDLYNIERYQEASLSYERLVGLGYEDQDLFYNLGNAYFKQDELGRAILNYLRAQRLSPNDDDIKANLKFVREQTTDASKPTEFGGSLASFSNAIPFASTNTIAVLLLGLWAVIAGSIAWWILKPTTGTMHPAFISAGTAGVLVILSVILLMGALNSDSAYDDTSVIVATEVGVLSGPGTQYIEEFTLHSGTETELIEVRGNWSLIAVPATDLQGWVPRHTVESVVPTTS